VGFGAVGLARNAVAIYDIVSYKASSFDGLPFLSPVLWLDMILVYDIAYSDPKTRPISYLAAGVGGGMYLVCFWLCVGCCFLGYGTRQYQALNIPQYCQNLGVSWQTDPRRKNFVRLQVVIFASASVGFIVAVVSYIRTERLKRRYAVPTREESAARDVARRRRPTAQENAPMGFIQRRVKSFGEWKEKVFGKLPKYPAGQQWSIPVLPKTKTSKGRRILFTIPTFQKPKLEISEHLTKVVMVFVVLPFIAGFIMAVILNDHAYLLLGQKGCYGSYVSGRFGYLDLELINFRIKLATWLGLYT